MPRKTTQDIVGSPGNVPGFGRTTNIDGHGVNHAYKMPAASPMKQGNSSYMHPYAPKPMSLEAPWSSVDKTLNEASRHPEQLSRSKTVFPVSTEKVRGAPKQPAFKSGPMKPSSPALK